MELSKNIENFLNSMNKGGCFLCVKDNFMTISWGSCGVLWNKEVIIVAVRPERYTFELLKNNKTFIVAVPKDGTLKEELIIAGSKSGRDSNKYVLTNLTKKKGEFVEDFKIDECETILECEIVATADFNDFKNSDIEKFYGKAGGKHVLFFGKILNS